MLIYLPHHKIDLKKWDACLERSTNGIIYGYSWYLDVVSPGWDAIVKTEAGKYVAIMPLPVRKKFGIMKYLIQPIFAQQLGVFYQEPLSGNEWEEIAAILRNKFRFITRYSFNIGNHDVLKNGLSGFTAHEYHTHHLNLKSDYQAIFSGYRQDRKWRLHKARRLGLKVQPSQNIDLMLKIFDENTAPRIKGVIGEKYEYRMLRELYQKAKTKNIAEMYQIQDAEDNVLAMAMLFYFKSQVIYIFNTSTAEGKQQGAIATLLDNFFKNKAGQDLCFDFESPEVPNVASFYRSFGSVEQPFITIAFDNLPAPVKWIKQIRYKFYKKFLVD